MSKSTAPDDTQTYEDLVERRNKLVEKLQEQTVQLEQIRKKKIAIQTLHDNLKKSQKEETLKYNEINIEGKQRILETKEQHLKTICQLKDEITKFQKPFEEMKANYQMVKQRLEFLQERGDMSREKLNREIMEVRYKSKMTDSKLIEVRNNVEKLREFLMINYPERFKEYISNERINDAFTFMNEDQTIDF